MRDFMKIMNFFNDRMDSMDGKKDFNYVMTCQRANELCKEEMLPTLKNIHDFRETILLNKISFTIL
jgi:hypothetical protein